MLTCVKRNLLIGLSQGILDALGIYQYTPQRTLIVPAAQLFCSDGSPTQPFCAAAVYGLGGFDQKNFNTSVLPIFFGHTPDSFAIKELAHFSQIVKSGNYPFVFRFMN